MSRHEIRGRLLRTSIVSVVGVLLGSAEMSAVSVGNTEAQVVQELGQPTGTMLMGSRKRMVYPRGAVVLVDGRVARFDQVLNTPAESAAVVGSQAQSGAAKSPAAIRGGTVALHGVVSDFAVSQRMFASASDYFSTPAQSAWAKQMASDREEKISPIEAATLSPGSESALLYVPKAYDGVKRFGLVVDVRPEDVGSLPRGYDSVCDAENLIWISPNHAGNDAHSARRAALALDCIATARRIFRIDDRRVYVAGHSGGAVIAARLAVLYPEYVRGVVINARGVLLQPVPTGDGRAWPSDFRFLNADAFRQASSHGLRAAFLSGPGDFNHALVQAAAPQWEQAGFPTKLIDVPGMAHEDAPAAAFSQGIAWIEASN